MAKPFEAPGYLKHKPIIVVNNYAKIDAIYAHNTDTVALSIGRAQFDAQEISVKVWRYVNDKWSRQSEELPLHRNLDLSILIIASLLTDTTSFYSTTSLREEVVDIKGVAEIQDYFKTHDNMLRPRLDELRKALNTLFEQDK